MMNLHVLPRTSYFPGLSLDIFHIFFSVLGKSNRTVPQNLGKSIYTNWAAVYRLPLFRNMVHSIFSRFFDNGLDALLRP